MFYVTQQARNRREELIAVAGGEKQAEMINDALNYRFGNEYTRFIVKGLYHLLKDNVEIPTNLTWMVESDKKHQEREVESRSRNLCGLDFPKKA